MLFNRIASALVLVGLLPSVGLAIDTNTIEYITKAAYMRTYEAKVCIDAIANRRAEVALGFCYSWYAQALDPNEKTTAKTFVNLAVAMIDEGIADERR